MLAQVYLEQILNYQSQAAKAPILLGNSVAVKAFLSPFTAFKCYYLLL